MATVGCQYRVSISEAIPISGILFNLISEFPFGALSLSHIFQYISLSLSHTQHSLHQRLPAFNLSQDEPKAQEKIDMIITERIKEIVGVDRGHFREQLVRTSKGALSSWRNTAAADQRS